MPGQVNSSRRPTVRKKTWRESTFGGKEKGADSLKKDAGRAVAINRNILHL